MFHIESRSLFDHRNAFYCEIASDYTNLVKALKEGNMWPKALLLYISSASGRARAKPLLIFAADVYAKMLKLKF